MNIKWIQTIRKVAFDSIKSSDTLNDICSKMKNSLNEIYGGNWHCVGFKKNTGSYSVRHKKGKFITFCVSDLKFILFVS